MVKRASREITMRARMEGETTSRTINQPKPLRAVEHYVYDKTVRERHEDLPYSDAELEAAAATVSSDKDNYENEADWLSSVESVAARKAEAVRVEEEAQARHLLWQEESRLRSEVAQMHREAGMENALFNYAKLIDDLLPKMMCVDFELLPREQQNTVVNLLDKTHRYLDGKLYEKPEKTYKRFRWASVHSHSSDVDDDD